MLTADDVVRMLNLQPHPVEGGYFRETYRSSDSLPASALPRHGKVRSVSTAIYFLLRPGMVSEMHLLPGDEVFHLYMGGPMRMLQLWPDGSSRHLTLGTDLAKGETPQIVVPGGVWQGSFLLEESPFVLLGATMAPGFDYVDYLTGKRAELTAKWPTEAEGIEKLTPKG